MSHSIDPRLTNTSPDGDPALAAALKSGWRAHDLVWERLQEAAAEAHTAGDVEAACALWRRAGKVAFWRFGRIDPRRGTSSANLGFALRAEGRAAAARRAYMRADRLWRHAPVWIERHMKIEGRGRSSLFHLRMEARDPSRHVANLRLRMARFAEEAADVLAAAAEGRPAPVRTFARWKGEKPSTYDDGRKLVAACLLIVTSPRDVPSGE